MKRWVSLDQVTARRDKLQEAQNEVITSDYHSTIPLGSFWSHRKSLSSTTCVRLGSYKAVSGRLTSILCRSRTEEETAERQQTEEFAFPSDSQMRRLSSETDFHYAVRTAPCKREWNQADSFPTLHQQTESAELRKNLHWRAGAVFGQMPMEGSPEQQNANMNIDLCECDAHIREGEMEWPI